MIGSRIGSIVGALISSAVGSSADDEGGYAPVGPGPGLVFISGSSNGQGIGIAASMTDYPAIATPLAGFQFSRLGASLAGAGGGAWVAEAKQDLQPRTAFISGYAVGTCGGELKMGLDLNTANAGLWGGATFTTDGALLHTTQHFLNPAWPTAGAQWLQRLYTAIDAAIVAHGKPLRVFVWMHGNDVNDGPSTTAYYANLVFLFDQIRRRYGNIGIVIERIFNKNSGGGLMPVRNAMESFALRPDSGRVRITCTDECGARDTAHYSDDAGGVLGYCEVGKRLAVQVLSAANNTFDLTTPFWAAQGVPVTAGSGANLTPDFTYVYGTFNSKQDIGVLWLSGSGVNTYATPAGWTLQVNAWGGSAADGRLQVWTKSLSPGETIPTILDVASDDAKIGGIAIVRNSSGLDVAATTATVTAAAPSATVTFPNATSVSANCLVFNILAHRTDASPHQCSTYVNGALTGLTEQVDYDNTIGLGYGMVICTGKKAVAGAVGTTTAILQSSVSQALATLVFKP